MISISKLWCNQDLEHDRLRYGVGTKTIDARDRRPIVVWNCTRTCNLKCIHCYSESTAQKYDNELTTDEGKALIDDLAGFNVPSILFSGGEPLMRPDIFELMAHASARGLRTVISTNGTLITPKIADKLKQLNISYVGISLDGIGKKNDEFRGSVGAFDKAAQAFKYCAAAGLRVGLRLTLTKHTCESLPAIFKFIEEYDVPRVCFYHLAYSGRGEGIAQQDLELEGTRAALDLIIEKTQEYHDRGIAKDILTVANHADGVYVYLKLKQANLDERARHVYELLKWNGGGRYSEGVGIACVDFFGEVHPSQFWMDYSFGNVRQRPFSEVWMDKNDQLHQGLRERLPLLKGRCGRCQFQELCGGSLRGRAKAKFDDVWMEDPACYLTDEEIL